MQGEVEGPLVQAGLLDKQFVDAWALNMYHDGSEGIQSHYDDAGRFERPITSLRLMSDSRLSFGTQLYGSVPKERQLFLLKKDSPCSYADICSFFSIQALDWQQCFRLSCAGALLSCLLITTCMEARRQSQS